MTSYLITIYFHNNINIDLHKKCWVKTHANTSDLSKSQITQIKKNNYQEKEVITRMTSSLEYLIRYSSSSMYYIKFTGT